MKVCLIEDNRDLGEAIERHLRKSGHAVTWNTDGDGVDELVRLDDFDVVILDLTLPAGDGTAILRRLRRERQDMPVLVATARAEIDDKVSLLDLGADDYLVKPFDIRELDARLRAVIRRKAGQPSSQVSIGALFVDQGGQTASIAGRLLELGQREFRVLEMLVASAGRVVTRERLMSRLFDMEYGGSENALELLVSRVRRKILGAGVEIATIRGVGYLLRVSVDAER
jgi:two-component system, OmpR family, response regulator TctD